MEQAVMLAPTIARHSVSTVPWAAFTCEGPECVGAQSVWITRRLSCTFIYVCRQKIEHFIYLVNHAMWDS